MTLAIRTRTYVCPICDHRWAQSPERACEGLLRRCRSSCLWALKSVVVDKMSNPVITKNLISSWDTVCSALLDLGRRLSHRRCFPPGGCVHDRCRRALLVPPRHRPVGYCHRLSHISAGTPARHRPARSADAFSSWLADQPDEFQNDIEHVVLGTLAGYTRSTIDVMPGATTVMDPFHVVALIGTKLDEAGEMAPERDPWTSGPVG